MRLPELIRLIAKRLKLVGLSRPQLTAASERVPSVVWRRPPLFTEATFDGVRLQDLLEFQCELDVTAFTEAYEEFICGYLITEELRGSSPYGWIRRRFGLTRMQATQLFTEHVRQGRRSSAPRETLQMVLALAALAKYTYGGEIEHDHVSFTVTCGKYRFGVEAGKPVTNLATQSARRVGQFYCQRGLQHYGRDLVVQREGSDASLFAELNAWAHAEPELLGGEAEGFLAFLNLARWRTYRDEVPIALREAIATLPDLKAQMQALRLAGGFDGFDQPYSELRAILVPVCLPNIEFSRRFSACRPGQRPTPQRQQEWRVALDNLAEELREAA